MKFGYLILILSLPFLFSGCKKNKLPFGISTSSTDNITSMSAICHGEIKKNDKAKITEVGISGAKMKTQH